MKDSFYVSLKNSRWLFIRLYLLRQHDAIDSVHLHTKTDAKHIFHVKITHTSKLGEAQKLFKPTEVIAST